WMVVGRGAEYASGRARSSRNPAESRDTTVSSARFVASSSTIRAHPGSDGFQTRTLPRPPAATHRSALHGDSPVLESPRRSRRRAVTPALRAARLILVRGLYAASA